jgi:aryl-alcohol dehydrogenase-like predicted oxidoreductase
METRRLGRDGAHVGVIGICPAGPDREILEARAREAGCTLVGESLPPGAVAVPYYLLDQRVSNERIMAARRDGVGVVAVHVLGGGRLGRHAEVLKGLVRQGRTLVQAAIRFVLANEAVAAARVRVSSREHLEEVLAAPESTPLNGSDLELIFEAWAHRND